MRTSLIIIFCFVQYLINAQDTIFKRSGEIISVKVIEVNIKEISYKRFDIADGPLFVINKDDIEKIKYQNGFIDAFIVSKKSAPLPIYSNPNFAFVENNKIFQDYRKGKYVYHGRTISDRKALSLAYQRNLVWNDSEIKSHITASKSNNALQKSIGISGAVLGGLGCYGSLIAATTSSSTNDGIIIGTVGIASAAIIVVSQVLAYQFKLRRLKHANKVVDLYNQLSPN